ncbi:MAG: hypothetical protein FWG82_00070 [Oscillospiraceae bacterium]|nr:hypothetical protein [Oscillospiraceae bacterium]
MKKTTKIMITVISTILVIPILALSYWGYRHIVPPSNKSITLVSSPMNFDDPREVVGVKQYVFVGYVEETYDYNLKRFTREFPESIHAFNEEFTECVVRIVRTIKGDLPEGEVFSFFKTGGYTKDLTFFRMHESDVTPTVGGLYIFTGVAHPCGTMTGGGNNGTIELEDWVTDETLEKSELYQKYVDAYENQILPGSKPTMQDFLDMLNNEEILKDWKTNKDLSTEELMEMHLATLDRPEPEIERFYATIDKNYGDGSHNAALKFLQDKRSAIYDTKWYAKMEEEYAYRVKNAANRQEQKDAEDILEWVQASRVAAENDVLRFAEEEARTATPEEAERIRKKAQDVLEEASQAAAEASESLAKEPAFEEGLPELTTQGPTRAGQPGVDVNDYE